MRRARPRPPSPPGSGSPRSRSRASARSCAPASSSARATRQAATTSASTSTSPPASATPPSPARSSSPTGSSCSSIRTRSLRRTAASAPRARRRISPSTPSGRPAPELVDHLNQLQVAVEEEVRLHTLIGVVVHAAVASGLHAEGGGAGDVGPPQVADVHSLPRHHAKSRERWLERLRSRLVVAGFVRERPAVEVLQQPFAVEQLAQHLAAAEADVADDPDPHPPCPKLLESCGDPRRQFQLDFPDRPEERRGDAGAPFPLRPK